MMPDSPKIPWWLFRLKMREKGDGCLIASPGPAIRLNLSFVNCHGLARKGLAGTKNAQQI